MPQYIRIAVIALSSAVISSQAFAQGNSNQSNGVPHVIEEALANGINVEVTNESPIEVTVSNFPDTSGGGDDESGYVGLSSVAMTGAGGPLARTRQCQIDYGSAARVCGTDDLLLTKDLTAVADDLEGIGTRVWTTPANDPYRNGQCLTDGSAQRGFAFYVRGQELLTYCDSSYPVACCR